MAPYTPTLVLRLISLCPRKSIMDDRTLLHLVLIIAVLSLASNALVLQKVRTADTLAGGPPANYYYGPSYLPVGSFTSLVTNGDFNAGRAGVNVDVPGWTVWTINDDLPEGQKLDVGYEINDWGLHGDDDKSFSAWTDPRADKDQIVLRLSQEISIRGWSDIDFLFASYIYSDAAFDKEMRDGMWAEMRATFMDDAGRERIIWPLDTVAASRGKLSSYHPLIRPDNWNIVSGVQVNFDYLERRGMVPFASEITRVRFEIVVAGNGNGLATFDGLHFDIPTRSI